MGLPRPNATSITLSVSWLTKSDKLPLELKTSTCLQLPQRVARCPEFDLGQRVQKLECLGMVYMQRSDTDEGPLSGGVGFLMRV